MKILKRCPFCNRVVWFWQKKCYLDAKRKRPCHAYCWVWKARVQKVTHVEEDDWAEDLWAASDSDELTTVTLIAAKGDEVKKVDDDTWRKDMKK